MIIAHLGEHHVHYDPFRFLWIIGYFHNHIVKSFGVERGNNFAVLQRSHRPHGTNVLQKDNLLPRL